ncbi:hypothetical protein HK097_009910, partial [Rhizophlyctis rosea]
MHAPNSPVEGLQVGYESDTKSNQQTPHTHKNEEEVFKEFEVEEEFGEEDEEGWEDEEEELVAVKKEEEEGEVEGDDDVEEEEKTLVKEEDEKKSSVQKAVYENAKKEIVGPNVQQAIKAFVDKNSTANLVTSFRAYLDHLNLPES